MGRVADPQSSIGSRVCHARGATRPTVRSLAGRTELTGISVSISVRAYKSARWEVLHTEYRKYLSPGHLRGRPCYSERVYRRLWILTTTTTNQLVTCWCAILPQVALNQDRIPWLICWEIWWCAIETKKSGIYVPLKDFSHIGYVPQQYIYTLSKEITAVVCWKLFSTANYFL